MQVDVETLSPVTKKLTVTLDKERVDKAFEDAYRTLSRTVQIKGFRPGKVPRSLIERRYGPALSQEIADRLVDETVEKAFTDNNLVPVGGVSVEKDEAQKGTGFRYQVRFDVAPEIPTVDLSGLAVTKQDTEPSEEDVNARLEEQRKSRTELVPVEDRGADTGDLVTLDFVGKLDGEPFKGGSAVDHELELGTGQFIPGFEDQLVGIRADESREVAVTFPVDYHATHLAGKAVTFDVTVSRVRHKEVPDLDDELARDLAYDSLDDMRAKMTAAIREEKEAEAKSDMTRQALEQLVGRTEFPVPPSMIESRTDALAERFADDLRRQGIDPAMLNLGSDTQRAILRQDAERQIREQLVVDKLAADHELTVADEELDKHLELLAEKTGRAIQWVRSNFGSGARADALKQQLLRDKVLDFVLARADVGSAAAAGGAPDTEGEAAPASDTTAQTEEQP